MKKVFNHSKLTYLICLVAIDVAFFTTTNPRHVAAPLLIIGFGLVVVSTYAFARVLLRLLHLYIPAVSHEHRLALFLTSAIGLLVGLQSIGQLTVRDVLVLVLLALLFYVYTAYVQPKADSA